MSDPREAFSDPLKLFCGGTAFLFAGCLGLVFVGAMVELEGVGKSMSHGRGARPDTTPYTVALVAAGVIGLGGALCAWGALRLQKSIRGAAGGYVAGALVLAVFAILAGFVNAGLEHETGVPATTKIALHAGSPLICALPVVALLLAVRRFAARNGWPRVPARARVALFVWCGALVVIGASVLGLVVAETAPTDKGGGLALRSVLLYVVGALVAGVAVVASLSAFLNAARVAVRVAEGKLKLVPPEGAEQPHGDEPAPKEKIASDEERE
jgi:hypothetical protein